MKHRYLLFCILVITLLLAACACTSAHQSEEPVFGTEQEEMPSTEVEEPPLDPAPVSDSDEETGPNTSATIKSLALCDDGVLYIGEQGLMLYNGRGTSQIVKEGVRRVQTVGENTVYVTEDGIYRYKDHLKITSETDFGFVAADGEKLLFYRASDEMLMIFDGQSTTLSKLLQGEIKYGTFFYKDGIIYAEGFDVSSDQNVVTTVRNETVETVTAEACYVAEDSVYLLQNGAILKDGKPLVQETEATLLAVTDFAIFDRQDNGRLIRYDLTGKTVETIENVTHLACTKGALICRQGDRLLKITQNSTEAYDAGNTVLNVYANDSFIASAGSEDLLLISSDGITIYNICGAGC